MNVKSTLLAQLEIAWQLTEYHLNDLTTEECLWRPAAKGLSVEQGEDAKWRAAWPDHEGYDLGPPSIGWITWHIGFWWSMVIDHSFGDGTLSHTSIHWPGTADEACLWIRDLKDAWLSHLAPLTDDDLASTQLTKWPMKDQPFAHVIGWVNIELTKNAAEIGYARFLYGVRT